MSETPEKQMTLQERVRELDKLMTPLPWFVIQADQQVAFGGQKTLCLSEEGSGSRGDDYMSLGSYEGRPGTLEALIELRTLAPHLADLLDAAEAKLETARVALEQIIREQPCIGDGGCFYPMHDGDGEYIGEQQVDPISVIGSMAQIAQDALLATLKP